MLRQRFSGSIKRFGVARRFFSNQVRISPEVQDAIASKKPVVALESTIITHGLPYPENLKMAQDVEQVIRDNGAVPATTAFVHGSPMVGLNSEHLEYLSNTPSLHKVSRRDVPIIMSHKLSGGTTIAGTMILAHRAGIKVFATGGLGGVHRGAETTMDVSADLDELARTPVGVVCSGPKSILDIEKTMEYLETKGVPVLTYGPQGTNVPGFYTSDSGVPSPYNFQTSEQAAELLFANDQMKLNNGTVFCVPTPPELSMPKCFIDGIIEQAVRDAAEQGVKGKAVTPFLLRRIWEHTKGSSLATNVGFVKNNAAIAARIASHLSTLEGSSLEKSSPYTVQVSSAAAKPATKEIAPADAIIVGTLAMDMTCNLQDHGSKLLHTSTPGTVETSVGGVGHNVALAATYGGQSSGTTVRLVTELGPDYASVVEQVDPTLDTTGIKQNKSSRTARYIAMHDSQGELVAACADMESAGHLDTTWISKQITSSKPKCVFFDGNIGNPQKTAVINSSREVGAIVGFEPASVPKAARLASLPGLGTFPNHSVDVCTPNAYELKALYEAFKEKELFDVDRWFPVIDRLRIGEDFRNSMEHLAVSVPELKDLNSSGLAQQAFHLLPYIPNLFVKRGNKGVIAFQLVENAHQVRQTLAGTGKMCIGQDGLGILVQHFPAQLLDDNAVVSVTGAGDTFCGILIAELAKDRAWLSDAGRRKLQVITRAQQSAALTVQSELAVNPRIASL